MAGERKGIMYEALVKIALDGLVRTRKLPGQVLWNQKPAAMSIDPDLSVGTDSDNLDFLFLVTHSSSEKNSNQKFWRNMGELVEAKTLLPSPPVVFNIVFDEAFKPDLAVIQRHAFDHEVRVSEMRAWKDFAKWSKRSASSLPQEKGEKYEVLRKVAREVPSVRSAIKFLTREIVKGAKAGPRKELGSLWSAQRRRPIPASPPARITALRRGLGKCLVVPSIYQDKSSWSSGRLHTRDGRVAVALGLARRTIGGRYRIHDPEVHWVTSGIPFETAKMVVDGQPLERMRVWIDPLQNLRLVSEQYDWVASNWASLGIPSFLFEKLRQCHADPSSIGPEISKTDDRVWLYHLLVDVLKCLSGKQQGFGLAALLDDIKRMRSSSAHQELVSDLCQSVGLAKVVWRDDRGVSLGLGDWANGPSAQSFPLYEDDLARIAAALANRIEALSPPPPDLLPKLVETIVATNLEAKLLPYRLYDPLRVILELGLSEQGITPKYIANFSTAFADRVRELTSLDPRSGGTALMSAGSTLINWQSVSDKGRDHKKKELCGRAIGLRHAWNGKARTFVKRPGVEKLILLLDGTWRQSDLDALARAGWDEIFYPDEMNKLAAAIV